MQHDVWIHVSTIHWQDEPLAVDTAQVSLGAPCDSIARRPFNLWRVRSRSYFGGILDHYRSGMRSGLSEAIVERAQAARRDCIDAQLVTPAPRLHQAQALAL
jgi:hypothetical protein